MKLKYQHTNCERCKVESASKYCDKCLEEIREVIRKEDLQEHEHRYYPNSRQKSDTCLICGFNPHHENYKK